MSLVYLFVLSVVQGITEFLPVSSSAHLILTPQLLGEADQGALIDVMAHAGSLLAVLIYFHRDIRSVAMGKVALIRGKMTPGGRLALLVGLATPPALIAGGILYVTGTADLLRSPIIIAWSTLIFAIPLWLADRYGPRSSRIESLSWMTAFLIGLAQVLAFIPGASRSGITMTAGRALGLTRTEAARFSMLMAIPIIAALGLAAMLELASGEIAGVSLTDGLIVASLSFVSALAAIAGLMALVERVGFLPFVLYRVALAVALLIWFA